MSQADIAVVAIGRNEGQRLVACLASLKSDFLHIIYVDSGSADESVHHAEKAGVQVIELDPSRPFTAARARSEGFAALQNSGKAPEFVQFIDGDCVLEPGWITTAKKALRKDTSLGMVTGWRSEMDPNASVYNTMCDFEWHGPVGDILACGGDMLVRSTAFLAAGGFDENVIAAEDDEFCIKLRKAGWRITRLPVAMTRHDAAMTRFSQWWNRAVRSGHGFAQVGAMHPEYFLPERRRVLIYGLVLPLLAFVFLIVAPALVGLVLLVYGLSYVRTYLGLKKKNVPPSKARHHAWFLSLSKFPNLLGMMVYYWRRLRRRKMQIIEYK